MQTVTDALVLRERRLDEQDRLLTLLSADRGIITAYAKGAGRMKGSMAGATELLCYSHFVLFRNRERCFADKAESNTLFFGIRGSLEKLTLATYFAQLCCELIPENEPAAEELRLMLNTLYYLEQDKLPPLQLKAILELRLLTLTGYMPDLIACRECGGLPEDGGVLFDPVGGSICCPTCAPEGAVGLLPLPAGARHLCVEIITVWDGRILTTLRHPQKHNGGFWEVTTGSAIAGEDTRSAAVRELYEETGIRAARESLIPFDHVITPRIFSDTYLLLLNEEPKITLQSTETVAYAWLTPEELLERCREGKVIGHLAERFARYAQMLNEVLPKEGNHE